MSCGQEGEGLAGQRGAGRGLRAGSESFTELHFTELSCHSRPELWRGRLVASAPTPEAEPTAPSPECPSRVGSPPPPPGPGAPLQTATPRSMLTKRILDHPLNQEKIKDQMRKKQPVRAAVSHPESMLVELPQPPRCLLPRLQPASFPV